MTSGRHSTSDGKKAGDSGLFLLIVLAASLLLTTVAAAQQIAIDLVQAELRYDSRTGEPLIAFKMSEASKRLFADLTARNVGRKLAMRVDGRVITSAVIREPIVGGSGQIASRFTIAEARDIAARLNSGKSKLEFEVRD